MRFFVSQNGHHKIVTRLLECGANPLMGEMSDDGIFLVYPLMAVV